MDNAKKLWRAGIACVAIGVVGGWFFTTLYYRHQVRMAAPAPSEYPRLSNSDLRNTTFAFADKLRGLVQRYEAETEAIARKVPLKSKPIGNEGLRALSASERGCFEKYNHEYRRGFSDEASLLGRELVKRTGKRSLFDKVGYPLEFNQYVTREVANDLEGKARALPPG
jgi:hypothetical protein